MEKEFVPYELALKMKALGFDEPCFGHYNNGELVYSSHTNNNMQRFRYSAPLYQQAFRWFREKYDLNYVIVKAESWFYTIIEYDAQEGFNTYEEAELACLENLIEIVESK
jgi:hypothetical protein